MSDFWTYKAPPTPQEPPPDCAMTQEEWVQLSPGYRRAIWSDFERMEKKK